MTKLLISVRDAREASAAISAGADLIDVKEPRLGSLGAASLQTVAEIARVVADRAPLSVACGELLEQDAISFGEITPDVSYAKFGLAGCGSLADWPERLQWVTRHWPTHITSVAVVYADWRLCGAPSPEQVLRHAVLLGCGAILFDTYDKAAGNLLTHVALQELGALKQQAQEHGLTFVLAGSLDAEAIEAVVSVQPDYIAVRGAVCRGGREGTLGGDKVVKLKSQLEKMAADAEENGVNVTA